MKHCTARARRRAAGRAGAHCRSVNELQNLNGIVTGRRCGRHDVLL
ncbi:hypothetical protein [Azospirillum largimobile]